MTGNILSKIPSDLQKEQVIDILKHENVRIERIVSKGHASPGSGWYDQADNEWVIVLEGSGKILFKDGNEFLLKRGDYLNIPKHTKHKVTWTDSETETVWLAIFYK